MGDSTEMAYRTLRELHARGAGGKEAGNNYEFGCDGVGWMVCACVYGRVVGGRKIVCGWVRCGIYIYIHIYIYRER